MAKEKEACRLASSNASMEKAALEELKLLLKELKLTSGFSAGGRRLVADLDSLLGRPEQPSLQPTRKCHSSASFPLNILLNKLGLCNLDTCSILLVCSISPRHPYMSTDSLVRTFPSSRPHA
jgi:hypothetical protein